MCSEAKLTANRLNAKKSTGPRTLEGKAVVAQNALKHGLLARQDLITGEDPQEFALCRDELLAELAPAGRMEAILAERIVSLAWRLKRAQRLQNQLFDYLLAKDLDLMLGGFLDRVTPKDIERMMGDPKTDPHVAMGRVLAADYSGNQVLDRMTLNERRIEGSLYRTMGELRRHQSARAQGVCRVPARASDVAQPPSAGTTAEGGGAPCVTTNGTHSAKQSQPEGQRPLGLRIERKDRAPGASCETKPTEAVTACAETQDVASLQGGRFCQTNPTGERSGA